MQISQNGKPAPRTVIISDLHLGAGNCQTDFLRGFLHDLDADVLVINGDMFDSYDHARLRKRHLKVLTQIRKLKKRVVVKYVGGNHDEFNGPSEYVFESGGKRVLVTHGHLFDAFIDAHPFLTIVADQLYNFLQWADRSHYLARWAKKGSKRFLHCVETIRNGALVRMKQKGCDIVCCGHTHYADSWPPYYNSGCWTELPCGYLVVTDGQVEQRFYGHTS